MPSTSRIALRSWEPKDPKFLHAEMVSGVVGIPNSVVKACSKIEAVLFANSFESSTLESLNVFGNVPDCPTKIEFGPTISLTLA